MSQPPSLYRRHRPQSFDQVVGQEHVVRTLRNAVEQGRVHHAYLFVGSRGTGKTSLAKILARSLNCVHGPTVTPCGECGPCRAIAAGTSLDVIEMDAASNRSVDDVRDLRERVGYAPAEGRWKVYILDEAHMLTREAWNAFLKTLEEPPPSTVFVLCTTEAHKVMATIADRCQRFDFQRPSLEQIATVIRRVADAEGIKADDGAIAAIARGATGSFRDALGTLDQLVAYGGKEVATEDVLAVLGIADAELILAAAGAIAAGDTRAVLEASERLGASGRDVTQFGRDLLAHLRALVVVRVLDDVPDAIALAVADPERLRESAAEFTDLGLTRAIDAIAAALAAVREGDEPRMSLDLALLRAASPQLDPSREAFAQRLERLEAAAGGTAAPAPARPAPAEPQPDLARQPAAAEAPAEVEAEAAEAPAEESEPDTGSGPVAQAVAVAESLDLERLLGMWPAVIEQVRQSGSEVLSHVLEAARPLAVDAEEAVLKLGFPSSASFNKRKAERPDARERFTEAIKAIAGERLRPVYVLLDGEGDEAGQAPMSEDEAIERFKTEFAAEEYDELEKSDAEAAS
ncbi:MAG: polymerase subunit gamma/tau [Solirubrobacterales bacterium]|nr:polymerase subunit gamma/tau [Solirubrobacterales bacterium]